MLRLFTGKAKVESIFEQQLLIENYNMLADAFQTVGVNLRKLNKNGMCNGLTVNYVLFAQENQKEEFYSYLYFIASLNRAKIQSLVKAYHQRQDTREIVIHTASDNIKVSRLLEFLKIVSDAQRNQAVKIIRAQIRKGSYMLVSMGEHIFAIEKDEAGFYVFESNNIERTLLKTEEVAEKIVTNIAKSGFFPAVNSNVTLAILCMSYGDKSSLVNDPRLIDGLIRKYESDIDAFELTHSRSRLKSLISEYCEGRLPRVELVLALHHKLTEYDDLPGNLINFKDRLLNYLAQEGVWDDQDHIDALLKTKPQFIKGTAYMHLISSLYLAARTNQIMLVNKLLAQVPLQAIKKEASKLMFSVGVGHAEIAFMLLNHGIDPDQVNEHREAKASFVDITR